MPAGTGCLSDGSARHARAGKRRSRTFRGERPAAPPMHMQVLASAVILLTITCMWCGRSTLDDHLLPVTSTFTVIH